MPCQREDLRLEQRAGLVAPPLAERGDPGLVAALAGAFQVSRESIYESAGATGLIAGLAEAGLRVPRVADFVRVLRDLFGVAGRLEKAAYGAIAAEERARLAEVKPATGRLCPPGQTEAELLAAAPLGEHPDRRARGGGAPGAGRRRPGGLPGATRRPARATGGGVGGRPGSWGGPCATAPRSA